MINAALAGAKEIAQRRKCKVDVHVDYEFPPITSNTKAWSTGPLSHFCPTQNFGEKPISRGTRTKLRFPFCTSVSGLPPSPCSEQSVQGL